MKKEQITIETKEQIEKLAAFESYKVDCVTLIKETLDDAKRSFILVGEYLWQLQQEYKRQQQEEKDFIKYMKKEVGFTKTTMYRYIKIYERFSDSRYKNFRISQLDEMVSMDEQQLEKVTENSTVKELREIKNADKEPKVKKEKKDAFANIVRNNIISTYDELKKEKKTVRVKSQMELLENQYKTYFGEVKIPTKI